MMRSLLMTGLAILLSLEFPSLAQTAEPPSPTVPLAFDAFLAEVAQNNLEYAAQRYNVSIAQAQIVQAKVFPNPVLGASGSTDISGQICPPASG